MTSKNCKTIRAVGVLLPCLVAIGLVAIGLAGCTRDKKPAVETSNAPDTSTAGTSVSAAGRTPKATAVAAVTALLDAERGGDHTAAFALLSSVGVAKYPSPDDWFRHRTEVAPVTDFSEESTTGESAGPSAKESDVRMLVRHQPGIDPFVGLQFAQEHQVWHARNEAGGWLVDPDPFVQPVVPAESGVRNVALQWAQESQRCDDKAAASLQAVNPLLGVSAGAVALCHSSGPLGVGTPSPASVGPETAGLVAQYGSDVVQYVRKVAIKGGPKPFNAFLLPIGDAWRVVAVND